MTKSTINLTDVDAYRDDKIISTVNYNDYFNLKMNFQKTGGNFKNGDVFTINIPKEIQVANWAVYPITDKNGNKVGTSTIDPSTNKITVKCDTN